MKPSEKIILFFSSGFGSGLIPGMPGTYGTIIAFLIHFILVAQFKISPLYFAALTLFSLFIGVWLSEKTAIFLKEKDPGKIVIDEVSGYWFSVVGIAFNWKIMLLAFLIFRVLDITKPFLIRSAERSLPGGWGIMMDDVIAGIFTNILLRVILYLF